ncbi:Mammalian uncoordinated homology 13, subgroup, domain 2 [Kalmanozyma brasiliensis GHG001]|uniref:Cytoplasm protein n=1 Tax=Kalmanozyma brasiliensis (strain GHG001) TaxID=1365824 RepID=V5GJ07_KALBG|nr:Mammalian uncoordinated homology 13, subgroup, domain 2 [Kalmanozyma brasiliensis GHG001]EST05967.1 Mammalian uncoordinated homology 13, subgroup, domain 2 [Kalmanozyma brasiliensis GHG001]
MTTRSTRSNRSGYAREVMTDGDVYVFLLQVAYHAHLSQARREAKAKAKETLALSPNPTGSLSAATSASAKKASESSKSDSWMGFAGLGDMIRDVGGSSKSARFPEKLIKRLNDRLELIAMGRDTNYKDQSLRQTIGIFYGTFKEASFQKQMKENRKIEELILIFVTTAQGSLKKRSAGDEWKQELNNQVGHFVNIIRECLKTVSSVPRELTERLESYSSKLAPSASSASVSSPAAVSSGSNGYAAAKDYMSASASASRRTSSASTVPTLSNPLADSTMVRTVGALFSVELSQLSQDIEFVKKTCTEQAAMTDLKRCVKNINLQQPWPGRKEDFASEEAYQQWRTQELSSLSQIMMEMCQNNPELLKSTSKDVPGLSPTRPSASRPESYAGASASGTPSTENASDTATPDAEFAGLSVDSADDDVFANFVYIPPDPRAYYHRALEICIDYDLEMIKHQPEEEEVSLSILSKSHVALLADCAERWRLAAPFVSVSHLDVIKAKYDNGEVPLDCVSESLGSVTRTLSEVDFAYWMQEEQAKLVKLYTSLFESFLRYLYETFQDIHNVETDDIQPYLAMVQDLHATGFVRQDKRLEAEAIALESHVEELKDAIRIMAIHEYTSKTTELFSEVVTNEVVPLVQLLDWLEKGAKRLDKRYPEPILGSVDAVSLLLEKQVPLFLDDLDSMKQQVVDHATRETDPLAFEDIFTLYNRVKALLRMYKAFCPDSAAATFSLTDWFEPHIRHWLMNSEKKTAEWVHNAIVNDTFTPIDSEGAVHSSSIDDLFGALQQPVDFVLGLKWPDAYQNARFLTTLSKIVSRAVEQYCSRVEEMFMEEMFPRTAEDQDMAQKQSAWMVKAKQTLSGEKKVEPFHFQSTSCVRLNNIEAARVLLDKLYQKIDADKQAEIVKRHAPEVPDKRAIGRFIFSIKIVLGENLQPVRDSGVNRIDSFVTLSDERGQKIAKTRTIYETSAPRWDEVFDVHVEQPMWLAATVWDRKLIGDHNLCGRAYLRLDPRYFGDFVSHELWMDLDTQGRLLCRVSMEGERDDILYHFGRGFRSLKRAESDMVRIIVDKMSVFIRQCLSRSLLKTLVKTSGINLDKAIGNVKALYASALASTSANTSMIPPVESEAKPKNRPVQLTDHEIESAIIPLFDYLDECLATLKGSLSEHEALLVLTKVWKEVLNIIESILVPPLSDSPSSMSQLSDKEVDIVFKWLSFLKNYFHAYDTETNITHGVPLDVLQGPKYREILSYLLLHDQSTDELMIECVRGMQLKMRRSGTQRGAKNKSVLNQRSLGTIKKRKQEKKEEDGEATANGSLDMAMKLLRMRPGTGDFLQQQMATMHMMQSAAVGASPARGSVAGSGGGGGGSAGNGGGGGGRQTMEMRLNAAAKRESRLPPMPTASQGLQGPAHIGAPKQQQGYQLRDDPMPTHAPSGPRSPGGPSLAGDRTSMAVYGDQPDTPTRRSSRQLPRTGTKGPRSQGGGDSVYSRISRQL